MSDRTQGENGTSRRWWPPKDPPMFLVMLVTLIAVVIYVCYTKRQVDATNNASIVSNRPYVMWGRYTAIPDQDNQRIDFGVQFINYGRTPAVGLKVRVCDPEVRDNGMNPSIVCTESNKPNPDATTVIGPSQERTQMFHHPIDKNIVYDTGTGHKNHIYLFGYTTYYDNLTPGQEHLTRFCHDVSVRTAEVPVPVPGQPAATAVNGMQATREITVQLERKIVEIQTVGCAEPTWVCVDENCPHLPSG